MGSDTAYEIGSIRNLRKKGGIEESRPSGVPEGHHEQVPAEKQEDIKEETAVVNFKDRGFLGIFMEQRDFLLCFRNEAPKYDGKANK